jgi:hypothetical protein
MVLEVDPSVVLNSHANPAGGEPVGQKIVDARLAVIEGVRGVMHQGLKMALRDQETWRRQQPPGPAGPVVQAREEECGGDPGERLRCECGDPQQRALVADQGELDLLRTQVAPQGRLGFLGRAHTDPRRWTRSRHGGATFLAWP